MGARPDAAWPDPESHRARRAIQLISLGTVAVTAAYLLWRVLETITPVSALLGIPLLALEAWSLGSFTLAAVASLQVSIYNMDLEPVFSSRGGIEATDAIDSRSSSGRYVRRRNILENETYITEGIRLAFHPFIAIEDWPGKR